MIIVSNKMSIFTSAILPNTYTPAKAYRKVSVYFDNRLDVSNIV